MTAYLVVILFHLSLSVIALANLSRNLCCTRKLEKDILIYRSITLQFHKQLSLSSKKLMEAWFDGKLSLQKIMTSKLNFVDN